jgi:hypothetical protein
MTKIEKEFKFEPISNSFEEKIEIMEELIKTFRKYDLIEAIYEITQYYDKDGTRYRKTTLKEKQHNKLCRFSKQKANLFQNFYNKTNKSFLEEDFNQKIETETKISEFEYNNNITKLKKHIKKYRYVINFDNLLLLNNFRLLKEKIGYTDHYDILIDQFYYSKRKNECFFEAELEDENDNFVYKPNEAIKKIETIINEILKNDNKKQIKFKNFNLSNIELAY